MTRSFDIGSKPGPGDDRQTREILALIADHIRNGTAPASPKPEHPTGSKA